MCLFLSLAASSCMKDLDNRTDKLPVVVEKAMNYHKSTNLPLKFYTDYQTDGASSESTLHPNWENSIVGEYDGVINIEVPLENPSYENSTDKKGETYQITNRLIILYEKEKQIYKQYICTKIWLREVPSLDSFSFRDLSSESHTLVYDLNGKITALYKTEGGKKIPTILNPPNISEEKLSVFKISASELSILTISIRKTKALPATGSCPRCHGIQYNYVCAFCECLFPSDTVFPIFFRNIVDEIVFIISSVFSKDCESTTYDGICYTFIVDTFIEYLRREREVLEGIMRALYYETIYFASTSFYLDESFYELFSTGSNPFYKHNGFIDLVTELILHRQSFIDFLKAEHQMIHNNSGGGSEPPEPDKPCPHKQCPICEGYYSITRSASAVNCAGHKTCPTNGKCQINVELSAPTEVTLGDKYTMEVKVTPTSIKPISISYEITNSKGQLFYLTHDSATNTFTTVSRAPGIYTIQAVCTFYGDQPDVRSTPVFMTHLYPSVGYVLADISIQDEMDNSWNETLNAADTNGTQEFGGAVMYNTQEEVAFYSYISQKGQKVSYASWRAGNIPEITIRYVDEDYGPINGGKFCVMLFHTHPPLTAYNGTDILYRRTGLSKQDSTETKIPSIVQDYRDSIHQSKNNTTTLTDSYNNGIGRRIK